MKPLTQTLRDELAKLHNDSPWFELWRIQVDATAVATTWIPLVRHSAPVVFGGVTYYPWPMSRAEITEDSEGTLPTCQLTLSNVDRTGSEWAEIGLGFRGRPAQLSIVHAAHLGSADHKISFEFTVAGIGVTREVVTLDMRTQRWLDAQIPHDRFAEDRCGLVYKGPVCRYTGTLPECGRLFSDCVARGDDEEARSLPRLHPLQFGAFPGISEGVRR